MALSLGMGITGRWNHRLEHTGRSHAQQGVALVVPDLEPQLLLVGMSQRGRFVGGIVRQHDGLKLQVVNHLLRIPTLIAAILEIERDHRSRRLRQFGVEQFVDLIASVVIAPERGQRSDQCHRYQQDTSEVTANRSQPTAPSR